MSAPQDVEALRIARGLCELCGVGHRLEPCPKCATITTALTAYASAERQAREAAERKLESQTMHARAIAGAADRMTAHERKQDEMLKTAWTERDTAQAELAGLRERVLLEYRRRLRDRPPARVRVREEDSPLAVILDDYLVTARQAAKKMKNSYERGEVEPRAEFDSLIATFADLKNAHRRAFTDAVREGEAAMDAKPDPPTPVEARHIEQGECWRKIHGQVVYLAISPSARKYNGLDSDKLYGVNASGNMAAVALDTLVVQMTAEDFHCLHWPADPIPEHQREVIEHNFLTYFYDVQDRAEAAEASVAKLEKRVEVILKIRDREIEQLDNARAELAVLKARHQMARERVKDLEHFLEQHLSYTGACEDGEEDSLCLSPECTYCELARALQPTLCGTPLNPLVHDLTPEDES